jgi:glutamate-ammonia-ligase adenylyltransferase
LVDLEFAVHTQQLRHRTGFDPDLGRAIDLLAGQGLLPPSLHQAHDLLMRMLVTMRLVAPDAALPDPATRAVIVRALHTEDWAGAVASFDAVRQEVAACWARIAAGADGA